MIGWIKSENNHPFFVIKVTAAAQMVDYTLKSKHSYRRFFQKQAREDIY